MSDSLRHDLSDGVATITFNRPERLNALTFEIYAELRDRLTELAHTPEANVIVITGEGRGFCSGGDVEEIIGQLVGRQAGELLQFTRMTGAVTRALRECPQPVIAAVNGVAAGAGSVIALASDFRLMARSASFAFLFTRVGLSGADMGSAYLLPRIVGLGRALDLILTGRAVGAEEALAIGFANRVVPSGTALAAAQQLARDIAAFPQACLRSDRRSVYDNLDAPTLPDALAHEFALGLGSLRAEGLAGADRFAAGEGRHGAFRSEHENF